MASIRRDVGSPALLDLAGQIYEAAVDPSKWGTALASLADAVGAQSGLLGFITPTRGHTAVSVWHEIDDDIVHRWQAEFAGFDPWYERGGVLPAGTILLGHTVIPWEELRTTEVHRALFQPAGIDDLLTAIMANNETGHDYLTLHRSRARGGFSRRDARLFHALSPHLQRANAIYRRLDGLALERAATAEVVDRLAAGVILLDERGRVLFENRAAHRMLRERDGLSLTAVGAIRAARPADDRRLRGLVAQACRSDATLRKATGGALAAHRPSGLRPYGVIVAPLALRQFVLTSRRPVAVLFVTDPEGSIEPLDRVREQFRLTPAETRVAEHLLRGERATEIASYLEVTLPTVRTHLRRLIEKTDARGQSDLVRILVSALAGLGRSNEV